MKYTLKNKEIELSEEEVAEIVKQNSVKEEKKIGVAIMSRYGGIKYQSTKTTFKEAVQECVDEAYKNGTRANLINANLTGANLTRADLTLANLTDADLTNANLTGANLTGANLSDANLRGADLTGADLTGANLTACEYYMGSSNRNFEALCKAIKTIKWNNNKGSDFL